MKKINLYILALCALFLFSCNDEDDVVISEKKKIDSIFPKEIMILMIKL